MAALETNSKRGAFRNQLVTRWFALCSRFILSACNLFVFFSFTLFHSSDTTTRELAQGRKLRACKTLWVARRSGPQQSLKGCLESRVQLAEGLSRPLHDLLASKNIFAKRAHCQ